MLQDHHGAKAVAPSQLADGYVYLRVFAADWLARWEAEAAETCSGVELAGGVVGLGRWGCR